MNSEKTTLALGGDTMSRTFLSVALLLGLVAGPALGQCFSSGTNPLEFDLIRTNTPGNPLHPGITFEYMPISDFFAEANGVAVVDVNQDGFLDVLFCAIEGHPNEFYLNNGDGTFTESAAAFGIDEPTKRRGNAMFFDYDNDGDLDLMTFGYPSKPYQNLDLHTMFRNDGGPGFTFTDVTVSAGGFIPDNSVETTTVGDPAGAAIADYNNDGYLDVIVNYWHRNNSIVGGSEDQFRLWKSQPNPDRNTSAPGYSPRIFVDATAEAGLIALGSHGDELDGWIWAPSWVDINRDGLMDLHINVEQEEDLLLLNQGDGTFGPNIATSTGMNFNDGTGGAMQGNEMGKVHGDFDHDGDLDFYLTNAGNLSIWHKLDAFYRNDTDLSIGGAGIQFTYIGAESVAFDASGVGWGATFSDLENDGDYDLLTSRGLGPFGPAENALFQNLYPQTSNGNVVFDEITDYFPEATGAGGCWDTSRALVAFDAENDGDLDVLMTRSGHSPPLPVDKLDAPFFLNTLVNTNRNIQVNLVEQGGSLNTIGARIFVRTGGTAGTTQMREVIAGSSFLTQEPYRQHFGLGEADADYVAVRWFDGGHSVLSPTPGTPLTGLQTLTRGADATGDLNGDGSLDDADLALVCQAMANRDAVDAAIPDQPWNILADADGNDLLDTRDFSDLRSRIPAPFVNIGNGLVGTHGVPVLSGTGTLVSGTPMSIDISGALESAPAFMLAGFGVMNAPLLGGVCIPSLDLATFGPFITSTTGNLNLPSVWPAGLPSDLQLQVQFWIQDGGGAGNYAATNGLSLMTP